jgi:probable addiction module antidote protein
MSRALKITAFDPADHLDSEETIAVFLADALASGSDEVFQNALQAAARARGMADIATAAGLGRESLYKALAPGAQPRFATVCKVMRALGVTMTIAPATPRTKKAAVRAPVAAARSRPAAKAAARKPRGAKPLP